MENVIVENKSSEESQPSKIPIPNSSTILVLGICSIPSCMCFGIVGLILGIIGLALSGKARRLYKENPTLYTKGSRGNLIAGTICSIVGVSVSAFFLIYCIILVLIFGLALGTAYGSMPWDNYYY